METNIREIPLAGIQIGERTRRVLGDLHALAQDIAEVGLLQPIAVDTANRLIFGHRRLLACRLLGWTSIPAQVRAADDIRRLELSENEQRLPFTISERAQLAKHLEGQIGNRQRSADRSTSAQLGGSFR